MSKDVKFVLRKEVYASRNLAYWSFAGIILPLAGWIIGSISLTKSKAIPKEDLDSELGAFNEKTRSIAKVSLILTTVLFVVMATIGGIGGYLIFSNAKNQQLIQEDNSRKLEQCIYDAKLGDRDWVELWNSGQEPPEPKEGSIEALNVTKCEEKY